MIKLYGHYASQPARSVIWLLKIHNQQFEFIKVEPLAGGTKKEEYKSKFPTALIPAIDDNGFYLTESTAIMQYLCEKYKYSNYWSIAPEFSKTRAKLSEYLFYHHTNVRKISELMVYKTFQEKFFKKKWDADEKLTAQQQTIPILEKFENIFLTPNSTHPFVQGMPHPTIADLAAYSEIAQLHHLNLMTLDPLQFPKINNWLQQMSKLPSHDDVHQTVIKIGSM